MEEEAAPLDQPMQPVGQMPQLGDLAESPSTLEEVIKTTNKQTQKGPTDPRGDALQACTGPDPSDGGTPHAMLQTQGHSPDVNMAELSDEITDKAEDTIHDLKGDINLIRLGLASYYPGSTDLVLCRESIMEIKASQLQKAAAIIIALLDLGIPGPEEMAFMGLEPSSWHRLVVLLLAAMLRGAEHTPNICKQGAADIRPCLDLFTVHNDILIPEMQGDLLRDLAAQLAGVLDAHPPVGRGNANPETYFDAIKLKLNANYEHVAEIKACKEAALWAQHFTVGLYNNELNTIIRKVQAMLCNAEWAGENQCQCMSKLQEEAKECHVQALTVAKSGVEYQARRAGKEERIRLFRLAILQGQAEALADTETHLLHSPRTWGLT